MVIIIVHTKRPGGDLFELCRCQQGKYWTPPESLLGPCRCRPCLRHTLILLVCITGTWDSLKPHLLLVRSVGRRPYPLGGRRGRAGAWTHRARPGRTEVPLVGAKPVGEAAAFCIWGQIGWGGYMWGDVTVSKHMGI